ncbi:hypothetical protein R1flu_002793 [Riccia fluitans]|uniref:Uncharacterized protein n=1 Tax=Riccia fluitans TaxID=41844 RepID=A0ABD1Y749_9MARC
MELQDQRGMGRSMKTEQRVPRTGISEKRKYNKSLKVSATPNEDDLGQKLQGERNTEPTKHTLKPDTEEDKEQGETTVILNVETHVVQTHEPRFSLHQRPTTTYHGLEKNRRCAGDRALLV